MKSLLCDLVAGLLLAGCSAVGKAPEAKYQSMFKSAPLAERVGDEWTGGPVGTK